MTIELALFCAWAEALLGVECVVVFFAAGRIFFSNRSVKQREDILTNKLAANTHVIVRKTQNCSVRYSK